MTQTQYMSLVEAAIKVVVGYALGVSVQIVAFSWFGLHLRLGENLTIGAVFVGISLLRSYALRRLFERWR
jgi:hypothetical protein